MSSNAYKNFFFLYYFTIFLPLNYITGYRKRAKISWQSLQSS